MKSFFMFFIKNYKMSGLMMLIMVFLGVMGMKNVKSESRPPVDFAKVSITTVYPGASPEEIEEMITNKIEDEIRSVEGVKDVSSTSETGQSNISIRIDMDHFNTDKVADDVQRSVQNRSCLSPLRFSSRLAHPAGTRQHRCSGISPKTPSARSPKSRSGAEE